MKLIITESQLKRIIEGGVRLSDEQVKERLAKAKEIAKNYKNPRQFSLDHYALWGFLRSYNFLDEVFPKRKRHLPIDRWDETTIPYEAEKYNSRREFAKGNQIAYHRALELNLLDDLFPKRKKIEKKYNLDISIKLVSDFDGPRSEFIKKYPAAYYILKDNNLLDRYLPKKSNKKNDEAELLDMAKKYKTHFELKKDNLALYQKLANRGILDLAFDRKKIWDERKGEKVNQAKKYDSPYELGKNDPNLYNYLYVNNLLDDVFGEKRKYINIMQKAKEYSNRYELKKNSPHIYKKLESAGLLDDIFPKNNQINENMKKIIITESQLKSIIKKIGDNKINEGAFVDDDGNLVGFESEDQKVTRFDLFGMTPAQIKESYPNLMISSADRIDKPIQYAVEFKSTGGFSAIGNAEAFVKEEGFVKGSMNGDEPMLVVRGDSDTEVELYGGGTRPAIITKWERIIGYMDQLDGIIITDEVGYRDGNAIVLFFNYYQ